MGLKPLRMQIGCQQREARSPSSAQPTPRTLCEVGEPIEKTKFAQYTEKDVQTRQTVANCGSTK